MAAIISLFYFNKMCQNYNLGEVAIKNIIFKYTSLNDSDKHKIKHL